MLKMFTLLAVYLWVQTSEALDGCEHKSGGVRDRIQFWRILELSSV